MTDLDPKPDPRINAYRPDLADARLKGRVDAARFTEGEPAQVITAPCTSLHRSPAPDAPRDSEILFGERVRVLDRANGWAWVASDIDGYVGYCYDTDLGPVGPSASHIVAVPRSHIYARPDLKTDPVDMVSMQSRISITGMQGNWARMTDGRYIYAAHIVSLNQDNDPDADAAPVDIAARFLETPYLWGGRTGFGLDCSALIQLSFQRCGYACPRDTYMQVDMPGEQLETGSELRKGDIVFWPGHVGMMMNDSAILHANATDMSTRIWQLERLSTHIEKIEGHPIRTILRPEYRPLPAQDGTS